MMTGVDSSPGRIEAREIQKQISIHAAGINYSVKPYTSRPPPIVEVQRLPHGPCKHHAEGHKEH